MAKLILSLDGMVLREYPLTKERTTIGRKSHNDIVIDNLAVSGEHAMIMTILNDSFLEDLGSTNGTLINGQPVKKHFLQNNDVIELGKYKLKYMAEGVQQAASADFEKTMVLRAPPGGGAPAGPPSAKAAAPEESQPVAKNFGDTVVNPELMQSQNAGGSLRDAARQAAVATGAPVPAAPAAAAPSAPAAPAAAPAAAKAGAPAAVAAPAAPPPGQPAAAAAEAVRRAAAQEARRA